MRMILLAALIVIATQMPGRSQELLPCKSYGDLAEAIMQSRQGGVPLSDTMSAANGIAILETLVIMAYAEPRYSTTKAQKRIVSDFRSDIELACFTERRQ